MLKKFSKLQLLPYPLSNEGLKYNGISWGLKINYTQQLGGKFITKAGGKVASGSPNKLVLEIRAPQGVLKHFFASLAGFNAHKVAAAWYCGRRRGRLKKWKAGDFLGREQWWMARAAPLLMNKVCDRNSYILCESLFCPARHSASCQDKHFTHSSLLSVFSCKRDLLDLRVESLLLSSTSNVQLLLNTQDAFTEKYFVKSFMENVGL